MNTPQASGTSGTYNSPTPDKEREDLGDRQLAGFLQSDGAHQLLASMKADIDCDMHVRLSKENPAYSGRHYNDMSEADQRITRQIEIDALSALSKARSAGSQDVRDAVIGDRSLRELRELAEKATPGPWNNSSNSIDDMTPDMYMTMEWIANGRYDPNDPDEHTNANVENDAAYIAAANPKAILSLISALEEARKAGFEALRLSVEWEATAKKESARAEAAEAALKEARQENGRLQATVTVLTEAHSIASQANRSTWQIAERDGKDTNWPGFRASLRNALETSHEALNTILASGNPFNHNPEKE